MTTLPPRDLIDVGDLGEHVTHPDAYAPPWQGSSRSGTWLAIGICLVALVILLASAIGWAS